jgi:hypothetical protein
MRIQTLVLFSVVSLPALASAELVTLDTTATAEPVASPFGARPERQPWEANQPEVRVELGSRTVVTDEVGFDLLGDDRDVSMVDLALSGRVFEGLSVGARYVGTERTGDAAALYDISVKLDGADLFARYTLDIIPWVAPYAELGLGLRVGDLDASSTSGSLADTAMAPAFDGALGVQVAYPIHRVSIGLFTDHGYQYTGELKFDEVELRADNSDAAPIDLGGLEVSGYRWRVGALLAVRF